MLQIFNNIHYSNTGLNYYIHFLKYYIYEIQVFN
jgi:hypothetical protein